MDKKRVKKFILLLATYFTILLTVNASNGKNDKNEKYPYNTNPTYSIEPYTTYSGGNIYIADKDTIMNVLVESNDIYVIDERNGTNPNMVVVNSYKIRSLKQIEELIDTLLQYEEENPSDWDRTKSSLYNEILLHNLGFDLGIEKIRTRNVDFDNNDQDKFESPILRRIIK